LRNGIIALDVDGTLLNDDHELTPRVRDAVRSAARKGAEIVLCTGRGSISALPILEALGLEGTMITHNGASIVDSATRTVLYEAEISHELAQRYVDYCLERQIHFDMNTSFELYVYQLDDAVSRMYDNHKARPTLRPVRAGLPEHVVKLSVYDENKARIDAVEEEWRLWQHELQCIRSGDCFIDIQHPQATKGDSLARLCELRGVSRTNVVAIGNYYNDIGMITFAGHGVAMANSPQEVLAAADEVAPSNNEDGVAVILERLGLA